MREKLREFLDERDSYVICQADITYTAYMKPQIGEEELEKHKLAEADKKYTDKIEEGTPAELVNLMRKEMPGQEQMLLRKKVLENDKECYESVCMKVLTNRQDTFINNAIHYILRSEYVTKEWVLSNYSNILSEYMKSLLCIKIGIEGTPEDIPFLMEEVERFERDYPDETYSQGPVIALEHIEDQWEKGKFD